MIHVNVPNFNIITEIQKEIVKKIFGIILVEPNEDLVIWFTGALGRIDNRPNRFLHHADDGLVRRVPAILNLSQNTQ